MSLILCSSSARVTKEPAKICLGNLNLVLCRELNNQADLVTENAIAMSFLLVLHTHSTQSNAYGNEYVKFHACSMVTKLRRTFDGRDGIREAMVVGSGFRFPSPPKTRHLRFRFAIVQ